MYGAFGFVKVQNPRGTGELRQIDKDDGKIPGNSEVNLSKSGFYQQLNELWRRSEAICTRSRMAGWRGQFPC